MITTRILSTNFALRRPTSKRGQTLAEYALILALISVVAIAALMNMGTQVKGVYTTVNRQLAIAGNGGPAAAAPPAQGP